MAAIDPNSLCDYSSSMDDSGDEKLRSKKSHRRKNHDKIDEKPIPASRESDASSGKKSTSEIKSRIPRQYREKPRSGSKESRSSSAELHSKEPSPIVKHSRDNDRDHHRRRSSSRHSDHNKRRRKSSSHRHRHHRHSSPKSSHRKNRSHRDRSRSSSRSSSRNGRRGGTSHKISRSSNADVSSKAKSKILELPKPVDPILATQEVVKKASAMMASALSKGVKTSSGETLPIVLTKLQEEQMLQAKAQAEAAAVAANLPKFYNPLSVNAAKLAEQEQKRKLLWSKKADDSKEEAKSSMWKTTSVVAGKGDSAAAAKFRKLMGIHGDGVEDDPSNSADASAAALDTARAQADLFHKLEREYEMSRTITHTQRGMGLGYSSAAQVGYGAYSAMQNSTTGEVEDAEAKQS